MMTHEDWMDLGAGVSKVKEVAHKFVLAKPEKVWKYAIGYLWCKPVYRVVVWLCQTLLLLCWLLCDWHWGWLLSATVMGAVISHCYYSLKRERRELIAGIQQHMMAEYEVKIGHEWLELMMVVKWKFLNKLPEFGYTIGTKRWNNWLKSA